MAQTGLSLLAAIQRVYGFLFNIRYFGPLFDSFTAIVAALINFLNGSFVASGYDKSNRPKKLLELYVYDGCPFCRKVFYAVSALGLDVMVYPVPRVTLKTYGEMKESRFRYRAKEIGGKAQFPLLVDKNTETVMYESKDIVDYLWKTYGNKATQPTSYKLGTFFGISNFLTNLLRPLGLLTSDRIKSQGLLRIRSKNPNQSLELWGYEGSPYVMRVKELLCSLELPYVYRTVPKFATDKRKEYSKRFAHMVPSYRKKVGLIQVPLLVDPNNNVEMLETSDILEYLRKTYKLEMANDA